MADYLSIGIVLGLSAGLAPGPLLTLVMSETLRHGIESGVKVAVAPLITDLPIVILAVFILSKLSVFKGILGVISICGGLFVLNMGIENMRVKEFGVRHEEMKPRSASRGILTNFLSPHPYLFWLSVGAPLMTEALKTGYWNAVSFVIGFYTLLVGSKVLLAVMVGKSKKLLEGRGYKYTLRLLGAALIALALTLFYEGLKLLGVMNLTGRSAGG